MDTNTNLLTASEICVIIETSAKAKVRRFSYGALRIDFGDILKTHEIETAQVVKPTPPTEATLSEEEHRHQNEEALELDALRAKEDRLSLMMIENPAEAERLISNGELSDYEEDGDDEFDDEG